MKTEDCTIKTYEYTKNPFTPSEKMRRFYFFLYAVCFNFLSGFVEYFYTGSDDVPLLKHIFFFAFMVYFTIVAIFITKKRILDITLKNKMSWILSILYFIVGGAAFFVNLLFLIVLPLGLVLLFAPSKKITVNEKAE